MSDLPHCVKHSIREYHRIEAKNSCFRASSALILNLGFRVKHLSTRSKSESGIALTKSGLFVFTMHQSRRLIYGTNRASRRSYDKMIQFSTLPLKYIIEQITFLEVKKQNTTGNEDSRLCSLATSHRASLPRNFTMSFMFLTVNNN